MNEKADRRPRAGMRMTDRIGDRQDRFHTRQRLTDDAGEETRRRLVGFARAYADGRQANADALEKAAPRVIGQQQFADRLLRAVGCEWRQREIDRDRVGKRRAVDRDRRGENHLGLVTAAGQTDGFEQRARAVEIDAIALVEIGLRFARHDAGEMEDDIRPFRDRLLGDAGPGEIACAGFDVIGKTGGPRRLHDIDQRQLLDDVVAERAVDNQPIRQLAADHAGGTGDQNMHWRLPVVRAISRSRVLLDVRRFEPIDLAQCRKQTHPDGGNQQRAGPADHHRGYRAEP